MDCIQPDGAGGFTCEGDPWEKNYPHGLVTYGIRSLSGQLNQSTERALYAFAFRTWSNILDIRFNEVRNWVTSNFRIEWRAPSHFDNALAHADSRHISFNKGVVWSEDRDNSRHDLFSVAAHEVGHVLGFDHVTDSDNIMFCGLSLGEIRRFVRREEFDLARSCYNLRQSKGSFRHGIVAGDYDGDGKDEIGLLRNSDGNVFILRFDSNLRLSEEASNWQVGHLSEWASACSANLDSSGKASLVGVRNRDGNFYAWQEDSPGVLVQLAQNTDPDPASDWVKVVAGDFDFNNAGQDEIVAVSNLEGNFYMYKFDGTDWLEQVTSNTEPGSGSNWADLVAGDFDNDGQDEIVAVRNFDGSFHMYKFFDAPDRLEEVAANARPGSGSQWVVLGSGDLDGDGVDEIVAARDYDGGIYVYKFNGTTTLEKIESLKLPPSAWRDITVGDFDGDGVDEIMAVRGYDSGVYLMKMLGGTLGIIAGNTLPGPDSEWRGITTTRMGPDLSKDIAVAIRDYDGNLHFLDYDQNEGNLRWLAVG